MEQQCLRNVDFCTLQEPPARHPPLFCGRLSSGRQIHGFPGAASTFAPQQLPNRNSHQNGANHRQLVGGRQRHHQEGRVFCVCYRGAS